MTIAANPPSTEEVVVTTIIEDLRTAFDELRCVGSERLVKAGVSMTHLHVLSMLDHHGEMPMSHLADLLDISVSNATGLVDRLEERGLVERVRDLHDRRVVIARLSTGGRAMLDEIQVLREDLIRSILGRLNMSQLDGVAQAIHDLRDAAMAVSSSEPELVAHWHAHAHPSTSAANR
jgi:MarR family transcriptional regulator, organic hydroperoxide resistance regulator